MRSKKLSIRLIVVSAMLFAVTLLVTSTHAFAQSGGARRFSSLPSEGQTSFSNSLKLIVPGVSSSQLAKLTASDGQEYDQFGFSIAISGNTVVVGCMDRNVAYVFVKPPTGWTDMTESAELTPSDNASDFSYTVGISGDTIVVGAPQTDAAYVFVRPAGGWTNMTETAKLTNPGSVYELAVSGRTVVVSSAYNNGVSYVFTEPRDGWKSTSEPDATLTVPFYGDFCQFCVGISGDTIAVGTPGSFYSEGTVYVFAKPAEGWRGNLAPIAALVASNGIFPDQLGISVAVGGDTIVAGANGSNGYEGSVYVFVEPTGGWQDMSQTAELTAPNTIDMGWAVAINENASTIVGGAFYTTVGSNQLEGAAYLYKEPKNGWKTTSQFNAEVTPSDGAPNEEFGASVGVSTATAVAGAPYAEIGSNIEQGAAYVFSKSFP
jgi:hypothetical protein